MKVYDLLMAKWSRMDRIVFELFDETGGGFYVVNVDVSKLRYEYLVFKEYMIGMKEVVESRFDRKLYEKVNLYRRNVNCIFGTSYELIYGTFASARQSTNIVLSYTNKKWVCDYCWMNGVRVVYNMKEWDWL